MASFGGRDRFLQAAPQRPGRALEALGVDHDIKVYPDAGHAFLHQPGAEPGKAAGILARITHAGYHEPSAHDARRRIHRVLRRAPENLVAPVMPAPRST